MWSTKVNRQLWLKTTRNLSSTTAVNASHYDVLGIHPKATQAEVKAAYYKLSKQHHPDTSEKDEGSDKFRLISEAYEVLGNYKSRQLYDRGLYGHGLRPTKSTQPEDPKMGFYKSRFHKERVPTYGEQKIYNFDEWTRQHYTETFNRSREFAGVRQRKASAQIDPRVKTDESATIFTLGFVTAVGLCLYMFSVSSIKDTPNGDKTEQSDTLD